MTYEIALHKPGADAPAIIARRADQADSFLSRFLGLMFRASFGSRDALVLAPCGSIHTFFMRFAIDVVCTDAAGRVVGCVEALRPWRLFAPRRRARTTLELPPGAIRRHAIAIGDHVHVLCGS